MINLRWWHISSILLFMILIISIIAPIVNSNFTQNMWGNVIAEIWGIAASALVAWIFFQRFRQDRLLLAPALYFDEPFQNMHSLSEKLLRLKLQNPDLPCLSDSIRTRFRQYGDTLLQRAIIYGRFLEIEVLAEIDESCTAANALSTIYEEDLKSNEQIAQLYVHLRNAYEYFGQLVDADIDDELINTACRFIRQLREENEGSPK